MRIDLYTNCCTIKESELIIHAGTFAKIDSRPLL